MLIKIIKNNTNQSRTYEGQTISANGSYTIPPSEWVRWAYSDLVLADIGNETIIVNDGNIDITSVSDAITHLRLEVPAKVETTAQPPFASKKLPDGSSLFLRVHGFSQAMTAGQQVNATFSVPYASAKINGIKIVNTEIGDYCDFKILDTPSGTISGVPNYQLNQFGYNVYLTAGDYVHTCQYDADLIQNLQIRISYTAVSNKTVYFNVILHQVVAP